jgi:hypothetical protein
VGLLANPSNKPKATRVEATSFPKEEKFLIFGFR